MLFFHYVIHCIFFPFLEYCLQRDGITYESLKFIIGFIYDRKKYPMVLEFVLFFFFFFNTRVWDLSVNECFAFWLMANKVHEITLIREFDNMCFLKYVDRERSLFIPNPLIKYHHVTSRPDNTSCLRHSCLSVTNLSLSSHDRLASRMNYIWFIPYNSVGEFLSNRSIKVFLVFPSRSPFIRSCFFFFYHLKRSVYFLYTLKDVII